MSQGSLAGTAFSSQAAHQRRGAADRVEHASRLPELLTATSLLRNEMAA